MRFWHRLFWQLLAHCFYLLLFSSTTKVCYSYNEVFGMLRRYEEVQMPSLWILLVRIHYRKIFIVYSKINNFNLIISVAHLIATKNTRQSNAFQRKIFKKMILLINFMMIENRYFNSLQTTLSIQINWLN